MAIPTSVPYYLNDPSNPDLLVEVSVPEKLNTLDIAVVGLKEAQRTVKPGTVGNQALCSYITTTNTMRYVQNILARFGSKLHRWASGKKLIIIPRAGRDLNAFYNRKHLAFFYDKPRGSDKVIFTVESPDVISHELGHAILDAIRPDFWSVQALEIWAFHESFADITAILGAMNHDILIEEALEESNGDLRNSTLISRLAEEVGIAIHNMNPNAGYDGVSLRDAANTFTYKNPEKLPKKGPNDVLLGDAHSFGRVFLGAWWECVVMAYELKRNDYKDDVTALKAARTVMSHLMIRAVKSAPRTVRFLEAVAKGMISIDKAIHKGEYGGILKSVFHRRKILKQKVKILSNQTLSKLEKHITDRDEIFSQNGTTIVKMTENNMLRLKDFVDPSTVRTLSVEGYDLYDLDIEIPLDRYFEFDKNGNLVDELGATDEEIIDGARRCMLYVADSLSSSDNTTWEVNDNKLERTLIH